MIRAWQKVRKRFKFISVGFDQYGCLKADTDNCRLGLHDFHATVRLLGEDGRFCGRCEVFPSFHPINHREEENNWISAALFSLFSDC